MKKAFPVGSWEDLKTPQERHFAAIALSIPLPRNVRRSSQMGDFLAFSKVSVTTMLAPSMLPTTPEWEYLMPQKVRRNALYRRVSSEDQEKGSSLSDQFEAFVGCVGIDGGVFKEEHVFTDVRSGDGKHWRDREGIKAMLSAAKRHEFDFVYVYCLDRFGRDPVIQEFLIQELKYYGVTLISMKKDEQTDGRSDPMALLARTFWGVMAQEELKKITERTHRGLKARVTKKGALLASRRPLYGYHWADKVMEWDGQTITVAKACYEVYEPEAKVVRFCFDLALKRTPVRRIALTLTQMGVPTPEGKQLWRPASIHNMLKHEGYTGQAYAWKHHYEYIPGQGMHRTVKDKSEWVSIEGCIPPLISVDNYERVQEYLVRNKEMSTRNNIHSLDALCRSGIARCGYCGHNLITFFDKTKGHTAYICYVKLHGYHECRGVRAKADCVDAAVWEKAKEIIRHPELVEEELKKRRVEDPTSGSLKAAEVLMRDVTDAIINLTKAMEHTTDPTTLVILTQRLEELAKQKASYETQYDQVMRYRINWEDAMRALDDFKDWCDEVRPRLGDDDYEPSYQEKRDALEFIGIRVAVFGRERKDRFRVDVEPSEIMSKFSTVSKSSYTCEHNQPLLSWFVEG